jgi:hypothetical protein
MGVAIISVGRLCAGFTLISSDKGLLAFPPREPSALVPVSQPGKLGLYDIAFMLEVFYSAAVHIHGKEMAVKVPECAT